MITLLCVLDGGPLDEPFAVDIPEGKLISHLKDMVKMRKGWEIDPDTLTVYKVSVPAGDTEELQLAIDRLDEKNDKLPSWESVGEVFPAPATKHIHAVIRTPDRPDASRKGRREYDSDDSVQLPDLPARNRELYQLIKERSPADPGTYADPGKLHYLPFPFIGPWPDRFEISDPNFSYMGREKFAELWSGVERLNIHKNRMYLYGTAGFGKSHLLAAIACLLIRQGKGVVYLPDCGAMLAGFVRYVKNALLLTFGDLPERQKQVEGLKTKTDINNFLDDHASHRGQLFFIIDQVNAFESEKGANHDKYSDSEKESAAGWLNKFSFPHLRIESASANNLSFRNTMHKESHDIKIAAQGGLSSTEMQEWWKRHSGLDLGEYTEEQVEDLTGRVPLLLARAFGDGKKLDLEAQGLIEVGQQAQEFVDRMWEDLKQKPDTWARYVSTMHSCILGHTLPYRPRELCDHRYFFAEYRAGSLVGFYVCGIARGAVTKKLRQYGGVKASESWWHLEFGSFIHNPSMRGFLVEEACLSSISIHGLNIGMELSNGVATEPFTGDFPRFSLESGVVLYIPVLFNFPAIDAIIVRLETKGGQKKAFLFPIQITIAKKHSDSVGKFFASWGHWSEQFSDEYEIEVHFLWITNDSTSSIKSYEGKTRASRSQGEKVISPDYTLHMVPLRLVSRDIAQRLQRALDKGSVTLPKVEPPKGLTQVSGGSEAGGEGSATVTDRLETAGAFPPKATTRDSSSAGPAGEGETGPLGSTDPTADHKGEASAASAAGGSAARGKGKAAAEGEVKNKRKKRPRRK